MMQALARVPVTRLISSRRSWLPILLWAALPFLAALLEHRAGAASGADHVLLGIFSTAAVPFLVFTIVGAIVSRDTLAESIRAVVGLGITPVRAATASALTAIAASAAVVGILGVAIVLIAGSPRPVVDAAQTLWIGAFAGAAYAAWFTFASTFGPRGAGRTIFLVLDYLFGTGQSTLALMTPRANLHSLLGGSAPHDISQRVSSVMLVALAVVFTLLALRRVAR